MHQHIDGLVSFLFLPLLEIVLNAYTSHQVRQKGGIGSSSHDPNQKDIRAFFGGGEVEKPVVALEHSESNAHDAADVEVEGA